MTLFSKKDKMCDVITQDYTLLQILSRFELPLGVGDTTVDDLCKQHNIDSDTFITILNFMANRQQTDIDIESVDLRTLMIYLRQSHSYFIDFSLPMIRTKLIQAINCSADNKIAFLILKFFDEYALEVRKHMEYEDSMVFPHIDCLLDNRPSSFDINRFANTHSNPDNIENKLSELKDVIIKYYPATSHNNLLNSVLFDIYSCERELVVHTELENMILVPTVQYKYKLAKTEIRKRKNFSDEESLSEREKDIITGVVKGLTNKEIAKQLFISPHTVITHRKNIARKLKIHSAAGLTIYAIVNKLVDINELKI